MPKRAKKKRAQREQHWLEQQVREYTHSSDDAHGPSGGQFYVLDMETGEKTPGLNLEEAKALWRTLPRACYFSMNEFTPGRAPLKAVFNAGQLP